MTDDGKPHRKRTICLKCDEPFVSTWEGNRICKRCEEEQRDVKCRACRCYLKDEESTDNGL